MLSIRFEGGGYIGKAPTGEYSSCYPCTSIQNKLTSNWVFGVTIPEMIMKLLSPLQQLLHWLFYFRSKSSICRHESLLPEFHTEMLLKFESVCCWKLKILFLPETYEMYAGFQNKTISIIFIKTHLKR